MRNTLDEIFLKILERILFQKFIFKLFAFDDNFRQKANAMIIHVWMNVSLWDASNYIMLSLLYFYINNIYVLFKQNH